MTQVRQDTGGHVSAEGVCTDPLLPAVRQALAVTARSLAGSTTRIPTLLRRLQTVCSLSVSPAGCRRLPTPAVHILLGRSAAPHWKMPLIHGTVQTRRGGWSMTASSFGELALTTQTGRSAFSKAASRPDRLLAGSASPKQSFMATRTQPTADVDGAPLERAHAAEADADDVAAPVGTACKPDVRSLTSRPGAAGPKARCHFSNRAAGPSSQQSFTEHVVKSAPFDSGQRAGSDQRRGDRG